MADKRLDEIDTLSAYDTNRFELLEDAEIEVSTEKGLKFSSSEEWFPKSRLRVDFEGNIYAEDWLAAKFYK